MITITLTSRIILKKADTPPCVLAGIRGYLTYDNPKYTEAKERGYWTGDIDAHICAYSEDSDHLYAFRGYLGNLIQHLSDTGLKYQLIDRRRTLPEADFTFTGDLWDYQDRAVTDALKKHFGILVAPCGSGKTVMALAILAERRQPTLVVVHTKELLNQWVDRIGQYLDISSDDIGIIGNGKETVQPITVGMVQTLCRRDLPEISRHFGHLICDEIQHTPASTFTEVITAFDAKYMLGLSATPYRRDGLNKLIFVTLGNIFATVTDRDLEDAGIRIRPEIISRQTDFWCDYQGASDYVPMIGALVEDPKRNSLIVSDVAGEYRDPETLSLILSDRKAHCKALASLLLREGIPCAVLIGDKPKRERRDIIQNLETGSLRVVLATGSLAGEGLDIPRLNRLFITTPLRWSGRVKQYVGRVLRNVDGKGSAKVYDYVDGNVGVLLNSYKSRFYGVYRGLNNEQSER